MFGRRFRIFTLAGFRVYLDISWFVIAALVTYSLAEGFFRSSAYPELRDEPLMRWMMGGGTALLFFISIVLHELGHAIMARQFGLHIRGITLFLFGGVAELTDEPPSAKAEFWVAIAGPIVSIALGLLFTALWMIDQPITTRAVFGYVGFINIFLVIFNMIPAFPLDGGRVLRAIIWGATRNLQSATRITSRIGEFFGIGFVVLGIVTLFTTANLIASVWWILIGFFLRHAARVSYQQLLLRRALEGVPVSRFMKAHPVTVEPTISIADLVERYIYRHHHKMYPVTTNGHLLGCVSTREIKNVPRHQWRDRTVGEVQGECHRDNTVHPETQAMEALAKMNRTDASRLLVVDDQGNLQGIVTRKDLLRFMALKLEMEK